MIDATLLRLTLRGLFGRRRFLFLLPLPLLLVGFALLPGAFGGDPADWAGPVLVDVGLGLVLPVMALVVGASALGSEIDDGTIVHVVTKPIPRRSIVVSKLVVAVGVTGVTIGAAAFLAGVVLDGIGLGLGMLAGAAVGAVAYNALFLLLSVVVRWPVLAGLFYVLVVEGFLVQVGSGVRLISIHQYALTVAESAGGAPLLAAALSLPVALTLAAVVAVGATVFATARLRSLTVVGDTA